MSCIKEQKENYREHARLHRNRIDRDQSDFESVIDVFFENFLLEKDQVIASYWPLGKEFDCRFLMDELTNRGYQCALPCIQKDSRILKFAKWSHDTKMTKGAFDIEEPENPEFIEPDILLAPLLAFDQKGARLGQGGGYYDMTLADLRQKKDVSYIGVGYAEQAVLFKLPTEEHDIRLDHMLTPQGVTDFGDKNK